MFLNRIGVNLSMRKLVGGSLAVQDAKRQVPARDRNPAGSVLQLVRDMDIVEDNYYRPLRQRMVEEQIKARGVADERVLAAMREVPRQLFVPAELQAEAYSDYPLPIGEGQTISQPYIVAVMLELMELKGEERVLEIGGGSGYQTALLAKLAKSVVALELFESHAARSEEALRKLGIRNVKVVAQNGIRGYAAKAPYDAIVLAAATVKVPQPLVDQLAEGGRLVLPLANDQTTQRLVKLVKTNGGLIPIYSLPCVFVPLLGEDGKMFGA